MKCELTVIDPHGWVSINVLIGEPRAIARTIAEFHADMQGEVNNDELDVYTILTEFNDEGIVK
jgi:hypothetical protein